MSDQPVGATEGKPQPHESAVLIPCPHLNAPVELSEDREQHIAQRHPELLPQHRDLVVGAIQAPDQVRASSRFAAAQLFSRWYTDLRGGKHVVVVVISEDSPRIRHWIVTAYLTRRLSEGSIAWTRD